METMTHRIVLELPESLIQRVEAIAIRQKQSLETLLIDLIDQAIDNIPLEFLPDEQILALCDRQMEANDQAQLSELLAQQREGDLSSDEQQKLDSLMEIYRQGLIEKARATQIAVERKLRSSLGFDFTEVQ
ncbi:MAG: hypothetical protein HC890_01380 [Chloroflexaceae bacterium]|nr:hypothetical protein [Chloroflexaceae bacterium]